MIDEQLPMSESKKMPREVVALGFVSMFMDVSSEMIHALLPVFLTSVLGASMSMVGLIEGIGEGTASISKVFSGWMSDRYGKRKAWAVFGYGLGALSKPFFAIAPSVSWVLGARFGDRIGKGLRGAPRDAMVADFAPPELRGAAFGLRQSMDTIGAFTGPLLALAIMAVHPGGFRLVFGLAIIPGFIAVAILATMVREPSRAPRSKPNPAPLHRSEVAKLPPAYWYVVAMGSVLTLARFSEAFLVLRAIDQGLRIALTPLVLILMNVVYAGCAYPFGGLSDRLGRAKLLIPGFAVLVVADIVLALAPGVGTTMLGIGLWGLHMGMTQGVLSALVADTSPSNLRGTAFGLFNLVCGICLMIASVVAGWLWQFVGPQATFFAGAACTGVGLLVAQLFGLRNRSS